MEKNKIAEYFDNKASSWEKTHKKNQENVDFIIKNAKIREGSAVLDVGCGVGALFDDYQKAGCQILVGVDISTNMLAVARKNHPTVTTICRDAADLCMQSRFDNIIVYNAINYFPYPEQLIHNLSHLLKPGGRLSVALDMDKEHLKEIADENKNGVSSKPIHSDDLAELMGKYLKTDIAISNKKIMLVSGTLVFEHDMQKGHLHNPDAKKKQLNRLARASGHLNHVKTMMENDEDVSDILIQLSAVISALNGLGKDIINEHIVHCLSHAIENGDEKAIDDLKKAIDKFI